ncbi:MAG TPA: lipid A biosynthesis acyltransferase [Accumulibacter sp.]|uniref:LpxL/LpxP family acyltransferase n=1 Tax=Accumulibacter sp. TaxID=2053492 RepID=UPI0026265315|nr:lipid A biosynthesis acyltransferase [Accumulibacter sp.]MDS4054473.1 lipid A biosynthesis acyltransferase [Accumulibacter sp.]HMV04884.1 lipid A biosynthesis acyltransferase [Accumulibacter sp.]HMW63721.1 lipid A biosynthesis acyltransferase [Accumulibacter sp.]HMW80349.1 lipid A biosynthesis acyltransferase [Accumulibacter sp.]HMX67986.1 lipid A biosynthesis acyltransferase [Accumulibacter sp.]
MFSRVLVAVLWLLHFLPLALLARLGHALGVALFAFAGRRRHIVLVNLGLCFPELSAAQREDLARAHFKVLGRSLLERSLLWWASRERLARLTRVEGAERIGELSAAGRPVLMLTPHFVGLDAGGIGIAMRYDSASIYAEQSDPVFDRLLYRGRRRFGDQLLLSRQDSVRASIKAMKAGRPLYYLPDMDFGARDSIFVPFFGVPAATIPGLSRLARLADAAVVPVITRILPGGQGYVVTVGEPWTDFPTADIVADTRRMNAWIEDAVRTMPEQYYWVHRRFKTRPAGEARPY